MSRNNIWTKELIELTSEIGMFLEDVMDEENDHSISLTQEALMSTPEMGYADAILNWRKDKMNAASFFSTDSQLLLKYKNKLEEKYGLPVLSLEEGKKREIELRKVMTVKNMRTKTFLN